MTYLKYSVLALMVVLVVMTAGCGTKDPLQSTDAKREIMPLKLGVVWTYDFEVYESGSPSPSIVMDYIVTIIGQDTLNNNVWYRARHILTDGMNADSSFWYYSVRDSGLYVTVGESEPILRKIKFPGAVGDHFEGFNEMLFHFFSLGEAPAEIMATNATTTVPLGTYSCYHSMINYANEINQHEYYAPDKGLVRSDMLAFNGTSFVPYIILKLKQFQIL